MAGTPGDPAAKPGAPVAPPKADAAHPATADKAPVTTAKGAEARAEGRPSRAPGAVWTTVAKEKKDPKTKEWPFPAMHYQPSTTVDLDRLRKEFGAAVKGDGDLSGKPVAYVDPARVLEIARFCHSVLGFDHLSFVSCCDYPAEKTIEMHWQLYSYQNGRHLVLKAHLDRDGPRSVASVTSVWMGADWHEREAWDLFGIRFEGHPKLRRIFLPEGWRGHPLLKDYDEKEQFIGMDDAGNDVVFDTPGPGRW